MLTSPFSGSVTIHDWSIIPVGYVISLSKTDGIKYDIQRQQMMYALFAQASQLSLFSSQNSESIDYKMYNMQFIEG